MQAAQRTLHATTLVHFIDMFNPSSLAQQPVASSSTDGKRRESDGAKISRARTGCITCRLRKKRCDEVKPVCETCTRLGIECLGYGKKRPEWMKDEENLRKLRDEIREKVMEQRNTRPKKRRVGSSDSSQSMENQDADVNETDFAVGPLDEVGMWDPAPLPGVFANIPSTGIGDTSRIGEPFALGAMDLNYEQRASVTALSRQSQSSAPNSTETDDIWTSLFQTTSPHINPSPTILSPNPYSLPATQVFDPSDGSPHMAYLYHYLNVVMPLQFRATKSAAIGQLVLPLAFERSEILTSISSLAALHLAQERTGRFTDNTHSRALSDLYPGFVPSDADTVVALSSHRNSIENLRHVTKENLTAEVVVFPALFAVSYYLFMGGTSAQWREVIDMCQKSLFAVFAASPDLTGDFSGYSRNPNVQTPWQRYRALIEAMIQTDIVGSLSLNRGSEMLPAYRTLLARMDSLAPPDQMISMLEVMGCDNLTLLAIAETTALSEWRDGAEAAGTLSQRTLVKRGKAIETLLSTKSWLKDYPIDLIASIGDLEGDFSSPPSERAMTLMMAEVFFHAARVYLFTVINGPFPKVPEIAEAVEAATNALKRIAQRYPRPDIYRKMVSPITITGCHVDGEAQQAFFRDCFRRLGPEAAFGNTKSALALMEEVWRKRRIGGPQAKIYWRETMVELGWEGGLLML